MKLISDRESTVKYYNYMCLLLNIYYGHSFPFQLLKCKFDISFFKKFYIYFYLGMCMHICAMVHLGKSKDILLESVLTSFSI